MIATVHPSSIQGTLRVPTSKSAMQRALAAALIRNGKTILLNPGNSEDDQAALRCIQVLGARVEIESDRWVVVSEGIRPVSDELDCGESGLSIRMFTPLAALSDRPMRIIGGGSLSKRPMQFFADVLPMLGVQVKLHEGRLPIELRGPLKPQDIEVDGSLSSQFLTGLLMAYSAVGLADRTIQVNDLKSRPYIDLTVQILQRFGLPVPINENYHRFTFTDQAPVPTNEPLIFSVEGDWSGASFWLAAAPIAGALTLQGLDQNSTQADRAFWSLLDRCGIQLQVDADKLEVGVGLPGAFEFDATDCPDLFPPLVALASHIRGTSVINGVHRLAHKESDRAKSLQAEFGKLGITISLQGDQMKIMGGTGVCAAVVDAHGDHRIAMALAVAALGASGPVHIEGAESVGKSYPDFWKDLQSLGATVSLSN